MDNKVTINEVLTIEQGGGFYNIEGNLVNGHLVAEVSCGEVSPNLYYITRRVRAINLETKRLYCECGRIFIIDEHLSFTKCNY